MLQCYNDMPERRIEYKNDKQMLEKIDQLEKVKLSSNFESIIKYVESVYECSGLCEAPWFYFSQPLTKGIPK